jgi:hemoglobin
MDGAPAESVYAAVGGMEFFTRLVDAFYDRVARDAALLALYPDTEDLGPARMRLRLFLAQYWGGPDTYSQMRGHPRLRMRHVPFAIDADARDRWLAAMNGALDEVAPPPGVDAAMRDHFAMAADAMRNR